MGIYKNLITFLQKRVLGNLLLTFITSSALQGIAVLTGILTPRMLGPTGKGELTAVIIFPAMLSLVGSLGLVEAINYFTASGESSKGKVLATGLYIGFFQSIILISIGWLLTPVFLQHQGEDLIRFGRYYLLVIPINLFALYYQAYLGGKLRFAEYNLVRLTVSGAILVGLLLLVFTSHDTSVLNVLIVYLTANAIALLVAATSVYSRRDETFYPDRQFVRPILSYGLKTQASGVTLMINERLDQLVIVMFLPAIQLGYYAAAVSLSSGVLVIGVSMAMVALPVVASRRTEEDQLTDIMRFFRVNLWLSLATAALFWVFLHYLLLFVFGAEYLPAENSARILLLAAIPLSGNRVLQASLKAVNIPLQAGIAELISAVLTVGLLIVFIPSLGIIGAALTSLFAYTVACIYMIWIIRTKLGCSLIDLFIPTISDYRYALNLVKRRV